jgi:hypothetical protein
MKLRSLKFSLMLLAALGSSQAFSVAKRITCAIPKYDPMTREDTLRYFKTNKINLLNPELMSDAELNSFFGSYLRFPENFRNEILKAGGNVLLIHGNGVSEDPKWPKSNVKTVEGKRTWDTIAGGGGFPPQGVPTRIVINRLVETNQGPADLFLHEHGHSLDSIFGEGTISNSEQWKTAMSEEPNLKDFLYVLSPDGYDYIYPKETFAELFDQYYACDETRIQMETEIPRIAQFFHEFTSLESFKKPSLFRRATHAPEMQPAQYQSSEVVTQESSTSAEPSGKKVAVDKALNSAGQTLNQASDKAGVVLGQAKDTTVRTFNRLKDRFFGKKEPKTE